jgi:hypothetical protein
VGFGLVRVFLRLAHLCKYNQGSVVQFLPVFQYGGTYVRLRVLELVALLK